MADDRSDIKLQLVTKGNFCHYDFRKSTGGFKGAEDGDDHKTIAEIDERHPDAVRDQVIAFFDRIGDELNGILCNFRVFGARLQVRKYDE